MQVTPKIPGDAAELRALSSAEWEVLKQRLLAEARIEQAAALRRAFGALFSVLRRFALMPVRLAGFADIDALVAQNLRRLASFIGRKHIPRAAAIPCPPAAHGRNV